VIVAFDLTVPLSANIGDSAKGSLKTGLIARIVSVGFIAVCLIAVLLILKRHGRSANSGGDNEGRKIVELEITSEQIDDLFEKTDVGSRWFMAHRRIVGQCGREITFLDHGINRIERINIVFFSSLT
jgi:hypothetical protein